MEYGHGRIRMLAEAALMLMLAMPAACFQFQAQGPLLLRSSSVSRPERIPLQGWAAYPLCRAARADARCASGVVLVCMAADGDPLRLHRASALRSMTAAVVASALPVEAALTEDDEEESDDSQVIDLDGVDGKKLAILVGAFVFADVISAFLTGRSVIPFPFGHRTHLSPILTHVPLYEHACTQSLISGLVCSFTCLMHSPFVHANTFAHASRVIARSRMRKSHTSPRAPVPVVFEQTVGMMFALTLHLTD